MNLGIAASLLLLAGAVALAVSRLCVRWMYRAANSSSKFRAMSIGLAAPALLFLVTVLPLFALVRLASGTAWAETPLRPVLLAAWFLTVAPGLWHLCRHARTIKAEFSARTMSARRPTR